MLAHIRKGRRRKTLKLSALKDIESKRVCEVLANIVARTLFFVHWKNGDRISRKVRKI